MSILRVCATASVLSCALNLIPVVHAAENATALQLGTDGEATADAIWLASRAGAALDSDLRRGGGTDDTGALQRVLDRAKTGRAVHLVIDGPALVGGLDVYSNTTIECTAGGGLYLKANADQALIRNAHRSRHAVTDAHITIRGCLLNGNRDGQPKGREPDGTPFKSGLQFFGVHHLTVENVVLWNTRAFGVWIANAKFITISNVVIDQQLPPYPERASAVDQRKYLDNLRSNIDGLHFNGPIQYLTINGLIVSSEDDALALNANDMFSEDMTLKNEMGPYVGQGAITDVTISNVVLMDVFQGIRLLSRDQRMDRIVIENVTGTVRHRMAILSRFSGPAPHIAAGNIGSVVFSNINVSPLRSATWPEIYPDRYPPGGPWFFADEEGELPLFSLNGRIESLSLHRVVTQPIDARPLIRVGPQAAIQTLSVDLSASDSLLQAIPLKLVAGGRVERLNFSLDWKGQVVDGGKSPIQYHGGAIEQLHWVHTPPMYVGAEVAKTDPHLVTVTLSQIVKAADLMKGIEIRVNGTAAPVVDAVRLGRGDMVRYRIGTAAQRGGAVTWAYDAAKGSIQNLDGDNLLSVTAKAVSNSR